MSPADARARAAEAYVLAEAADHPRDKAALRSAAAAWERIARGGAGWSHRPLQRAVVVLKREVAVAAGPFRRPEPPRSPPPARVAPIQQAHAGAPAAKRRDGAAAYQEYATIDF